MVAMDLLRQRGTRNAPPTTPTATEERVPETPMPGTEGDPDANPGGEAGSSRPEISTRHDYIKPKMNYVDAMQSLWKTQKKLQEKQNDNDMRTATSSR